MTQPGSVHPSGGAASRTSSPARLVLAVGLLALGLGDLTIINLVLLPRYLAGETGELRAMSRAIPGPAAAAVSVPPSPVAGARQPLPAAPPLMDEAAAPEAPAAKPPPHLRDQAPTPTPPAAEQPQPPESPAPPAPDGYPDLLFALNATWLSPTSRATLDTLSEALKQTPQRRVVLRGHADRKGPEEFNRALSLARARQARRYLQVSGVEASRIEIQSFGSRRPADEETTSTAQARNRRVEIEVY